MPKMSRIETAFCRSSAWGHFAGSVILPWALQGHDLSGDVLELGAGSGAAAAALLQRAPGIRLTVTDSGTPTGRPAARIRSDRLADSEADPPHRPIAAPASATCRTDSHSADGGSRYGGTHGAFAPGDAIPCPEVNRPGRSLFGRGVVCPKCVETDVPLIELG